MFALKFFATAVCSFIFLIQNLGVQNLSAAEVNIDEKINDINRHTAIGLDFAFKNSDTKPGLGLILLNELKNSEIPAMNQFTPEVRNENALRRMQKNEEKLNILIQDQKMGHESAPEVRKWFNDISTVAATGAGVTGNVPAAAGIVGGQIVVNKGWNVVNELGAPGAALSADQQLLAPQTSFVIDRHAVERITEICETKPIPECPALKLFIKNHGGRPEASEEHITTTNEAVRVKMQAMKQTDIYKGAKSAVRERKVMSPAALSSLRKQTQIKFENAKQELAKSLPEIIKEAQQADASELIKEENARRFSNKKFSSTDAEESGALRAKFEEGTDISLDFAEKVGSYIDPKTTRVVVTVGRGYLAASKAVDGITGALNAPATYTKIFGTMNGITSLISIGSMIASSFMGGESETATILKAIRQLELSMTDHFQSMAELIQGLSKQIESLRVFNSRWFQQLDKKLDQNLAQTTRKLDELSRYLADQKQSINAIASQLSLTSRQLFQLSSDVRVLGGDILRGKLENADETCIMPYRKVVELEKKKHRRLKLPELSAKDFENCLKDAFIFAFVDSQKASLSISSQSWADPSSLYHQILSSQSAEQFAFLRELAFVLAGTADPQKLKAKKSDGEENISPQRVANIEAWAAGTKTYIKILKVMKAYAPQHLEAVEASAMDHLERLILAGSLIVDTSTQFIQLDGKPIREALKNYEAAVKKLNPSAQEVQSQTLSSNLSIAPQDEFAETNESFDIYGKIDQETNHLISDSVPFCNHESDENQVWRELPLRKQTRMELSKRFARFEILKMGKIKVCYEVKAASKPRTIPLRVNGNAENDPEFFPFYAQKLRNWHDSNAPQNDARGYEITSDLILQQFYLTLHISLKPNRSEKEVELAIMGFDATPIEFPIGARVTGRQVAGNDDWRRIVDGAVYAQNTDTRPYPLPKIKQIANSCLQQRVTTVFDRIKDFPEDQVLQFDIRRFYLAHVPEYLDVGNSRHRANIEDFNHKAEKKLEELRTKTHSELNATSQRSGKVENILNEIGFWKEVAERYYRFAFEKTSRESPIAKSLLGGFMQLPGMEKFQEETKKSDAAPYVSFTEKAVRARKGFEDVLDMSLHRASQGEGMIQAQQLISQLCSLDKNLFDDEVEDCSPAK